MGKSQVKASTAYFAYSASLLVKIADILKYSSDAAHYQEVSEYAKKAFHFAATKKGRIFSLWQRGEVKASLNHYSYGAICAWLFSGVCGINLENNQLTIAPKPHKALGFAKAKYNSPWV